ncbi:MAG: c-type cytochrome [Thiomicrorhabdus chilensis]|uniref:c-type cytochrome n=1 Tax=Thiomicrorhabdus chilensis TaxID=63656 RepID=UPI00299D1A60|nr:c-type cytochrome [Thiomicrorhabdus chilensis]MDX1347221.1 c-type cytochrome [Thiomicrorhabdus chilensis]
MKKRIHVLVAAAVLAVPAISYSAGISDAELSATTCFSCHGPEGKNVGGAIPALAGYPEKVMVEQLKNFKSGQRPSTVMQRHIKGYSDAEIEDLARYFSTLKP